MKFNLITAKDDFPTLEMAEEEGFFIDGEMLGGTQSVEIRSPIQGGTELLIKVAIKA